MHIIDTSKERRGQPHSPAVNAIALIPVLFLVLVIRGSAHLGLWHCPWA
ncbi:hypothetical protein [Paraburkholderia sp. BR14374]